MAKVTQQKKKKKKKKTSLGQLAYEAHFNEGAPWDTVADRLGYRSPLEARDRAEHYRLYHKLPGYKQSEAYRQRIDAERARRPTHCAQCHANLRHIQYKSRGGGGKKPHMSKGLCNACYSYEKITGRKRPEKLYRPDPTYQEIAAHGPE